jgi:hypothetical protein
MNDWDSYLEDMVLLIRPIRQSSSWEVSSSLLEKIVSAPCKEWEHLSLFC